MKYPSLVLLFSLSLATTSVAAESFETQLKAFQKNASATVSKTASAPGERRGEAALYAITNLSQFTTSNANLQELERAINSIVALAPNDTEISAAADALIATAKTERQTRVERARAEIDALLKKAGEACLAAKTPADLDATLTLLAPYNRNSGYDRRTDDQESSQRAANAYRFVTRWQDYLAARSSKISNEATGILRDLSNSVDVALMPRSTIIALLTPQTSSPAESANTPDNPLALIIPKLETAKTLDDFITITRSLTGVTRNNQYPQTSLQQVLIGLVEERQQVLSGNRPYSLFTSDNNNRQLSAQDPAYTPGIQTAILAFRRENQLLGIALTFPGAKLPAATAEETPEAYLIRLVEKFVAANDWLQVREGLELYRTFPNNNRGSNWVAGDIEACNAYIAARNLDRAEQFSAAVTSYQRALRSVGRYVPVDAIGARLAEIKKTNPEAFNSSSAPTGPAYPVNRYNDQPPGTGPSVPRSPGGLRPSAPTGPQTTTP